MLEQLLSIEKADQTEMNPMDLYASQMNLRIVCLRQAPAKNESACILVRLQPNSMVTLLQNNKPGSKLAYLITFNSYSF
jgi:hypothetical protein